MAKNQECKRCYGLSCPHWLGCFPELVSDIKQLQLELVLVTKLVLDKPELFDILDVACAKKIRDRIRQSPFGRLVQVDEGED